MNRKSIVSTTMGLLGLVAFPGDTQAYALGSWAPRPGCATWVTQGSAYGSAGAYVYVAGCGTGPNQQLYSCLGSCNHSDPNEFWQHMPGLSAVQISAFDLGSIWARRSDGTVYRRTEQGGWSGPLTFGGGYACASYIAAGDSGSVYTLGCESSANKSIWKRLSNGTWLSLPGAAAQITTTNDGLPWVVSAAGVSYRWNGSGWAWLPGTTNQLMTGASFVYMAKGINDGVVYRWENNSWHTHFPPPDLFHPIRLFTQQWAISPSGAIFRWLNVLEGG
ncbi:MAG: hypothetical protein KF718_20780 [Polyangiaceae bacterium]|nr:hypothetical protein [Polyangiaceae bacterium]